MALIPSGLDFEKSLKKTSRSEPAKGYLWHVALPDLTNTPQPANTESIKEAERRWKSGPNRNIDMELINTLVTDMTTPYFEFETGKVTNGSSFWFEAKHNDISNITITIEEQESGIVYQYLKNWGDLIVNQDGSYNPPNFYKRPIFFYRLNMVKAEFQAFQYEDYFITEISSRSNTYGSVEAVTYDVSFKGDSLKKVEVVSGEELLSTIESVSSQLDVEIPRRFDFSGFSAADASGLLSNIGNRIL